MKKLILTLTVLFATIVSTVNAQTSVIDGHVYLENQTYHDSIMVVFERTVPSTLYDTAYTDSSGYFNKTIQQGIYNVTYKKMGYFTVSYVDLNFYSNYTIADTTLEFIAVESLCGQLSGTISTGNYYINCNIEVANGDTLVIEPGVTMFFCQDINFDINGLLIAEGTEIDSIKFTKYPDPNGITWKGINFNDSANDNSILSYCLIEYSDSNGIYCNNSSPSLTNLTIQNNSGSPGGGIFCSNSNLILNNIIIQGNILSSGSSGGGIFCSNSSLILTNIIIRNNTAGDIWNYSSGGGIFCSNSNLTLTNVEIQGNWCNNEGGGIMCCSSSNLTLTNVKIQGNATHSNYGGGIYSSNSTLKLTNVSIIENGGINGIMINSGFTTHIINSIIANNNGYGIQDLYNNSSETIINSDFWNNSSGNFNNCGSWVGVNVTVNANGDSIDPYGNMQLDPLFVNDSAGDFHLLAGSPCIDAGTPDTTGLNLPPYDLDGNARIFDGNYDGDTIIDIGPYEYGAPFMVIHDLGAIVKLLPQSSCNLGNSEHIQVQFRNLGTLTEQGFDISYSTDSGTTWVTETFTDSVQAFHQTYYTFNTTADFSGSGTYHCFVALGLTNDTNTANDTLYFEISNENTLIVNTIIVDSISCYGMSNGSAQVSTTGGTVPYTYLWSNGNTDTLVENLSAQTYYVTVTDSLGCSAIAQITLTQPDSLALTVSNIQDATCGQNNGQATANVSGGTPPYNYNWSNSDTLNYTDSLPAGMNSVIVVDANGCSVNQYFTVNSIGGPTVTIDNQTDVSCNGGSDGAISTTISPNSIIEWSTGDTTTSITNLSAGPYDLTVTDNMGCVTMQSIEITEPEEIIVDYTITQSSCGQNDGEITANITGGTSPYTLNWSSGTNTNLSAGTYTLTVTDNNGCEKIETVNISDATAPQIIVDSIISAPCGGPGAIYVSILGASGNQTYNWNNLFYMEDLPAVAPGNYTLTVNDGGCITILDTVIPDVLPNTQEICVVTVDSIVGNNLVVWEKEITNEIAYYKIYRESSVPCDYQFIDSVLYDDMSEYYDPVANPFVRSWRYKISAVNLCGVESRLSQIHKTIHLNINAGLSGSYNLMWDDYEGFPYTTFYIYRHLNTTGWLLIDSLPNTLHSYTDIPPDTSGLWYAVTVNTPGDCIPTSSAKATGGPYSQSTSNIEDDEGIIVTYISNSGFSNLKIYPNPNTGQFTIELPANEPTEISGYDLSGKLVYQTKTNTIKTNIGIQNLDKGVYIFKLTNNKEISRFRIVVQ